MAEDRFIQEGKEKRNPRPARCTSDDVDSGLGSIMDSTENALFAEHDRLFAKCRSQMMKELGGLTEAMRQDYRVMWF